MKKDTVFELAAGVALVVLGYAVWQHFKGGGGLGAGGATGGVFQNPVGLGGDVFPVAMRPDSGWGYDPYNPGEFIPVNDLINGTIADLSSGQRAGYEMPWSGDLISQAVSDIYGTSDPTRSIIVKPWGQTW